VLDPGLRLRVRSLRGPLEDAMRCYAEVRGLLWERQPAPVSCTRWPTAPRQQQQQLHACHCRT
jgi:hypothetical protein